MKTKIDVKFRIRPQRVKNATEGLEVQSGGKHLVTMRVVFNSLRMEFSTGYHVNAKNRVIFLSMDELKILENYQIPEEKTYLIYTRDVFLFMCFTGLRYSDVTNLRRCDIYDDRIEITTAKTYEALVINLNKYSSSILKKYEDTEFKRDAALPVVSNQKMNKNLHEFSLYHFKSDPKYNSWIDIQLTADFPSCLQ